MSARFLDLAVRPFANARPLRRVAIALWILGALLAIANTRLYLRSFSGLENTQRDLAEIQQQIAELEDSVESTTSTLRAMDLDTQNDQVTFLNERIAERTFGWGRLFDRLGEVLPDQVRLTRLSPKVLGGDDSGRRRARNSRRSEPSSDPSRVHLQMTGTAEGDEALLDFIDRLYQDPAFANPSLANEARDLGILRTFTLSVSYLPGSDADSTGSAAETAADAAAIAAADVAAAQGADESRSGALASVGETADPFAGSAATPPTDSSPSAAPTVEDRTGAGRYYGADDPRSGGTRRRAPLRSTRATARERAAAAAERTGQVPTGAAAVGGLQYVGGNARPGQDPSDVTPIPLGGRASDTGGIR